MGGAANNNAYYSDTENKDESFAPGNNWITLTKRGKNFYAPELFYKCPFINQIVPLRIKDIFKSADLFKIYGNSALSLVKKNTLLVNNYPLKLISVTARIIGQSVKTFESEKVHEDDWREPIYFLNLCDSSGAVLTCVVPEHKIIGCGLLTGNSANNGVLIKVIGKIRYFLSSYATNIRKRSKKFHPVEIEILCKRDSRSMLVELQEWKKTLDFREKLLTDPWVINDLPSPQTTKQAFVDLNNLLIQNDILVARDLANNNDLSSYGMNKKSLQISSFKVDENEILNLVNDSLYLDDKSGNTSIKTAQGNEIAIRKKDLLSRIVQVLSQDNDIADEENKKDFIDLDDDEYHDTQIINTDESDSDIEEIAKESLSDSYVEARQKELESMHLHKVTKKSIKALIPANEEKKRKFIKSDTVCIDLTVEEDLTEPVCKPNHHNTYFFFDPCFDGGRSFVDLLNDKKLVTSMNKNINLAKQVVRDNHNMITKLNYSVEFIKYFIGLKNAIIDQGEVGRLVGKRSVDLKIIYLDLILSNFLSLLVVKYYFIILFTCDNTLCWPQGMINPLDADTFLRYFTPLASNYSNKQDFLPRILERLNDTSQAQFKRLISSRDFNLLKSKVFHRIRHEFTNCGLIRGYKVSNHFIRSNGVNNWQQQQQQQQKIYINFDNIGSLFKIIIKAMKLFLNDAYLQYFEKIDLFIQTTLRHIGDPNRSSDLKISHFQCHGNFFQYSETLSLKLLKTNIESVLKINFNFNIESSSAAITGASRGHNNTNNISTDATNTLYIISKLVDYAAFQTTELLSFEDDIISNYFFREILAAELDLKQLDKIKSMVGFKKLQWVEAFDEGGWKLQLDANDN